MSSGYLDIHLAVARDLAVASLEVMTGRLEMRPNLSMQCVMGPVGFDQNDQYDYYYQYD